MFTPGPITAREAQASSQPSFSCGVGRAAPMGRWRGDPTGKSRCWYQNGRWRLERQKQHGPTPASAHAPRAECGAEEAASRAPRLITGLPFLAEVRPSAPVTCPHCSACSTVLSEAWSRPGWSCTSLRSLCPHRLGRGPFRKGRARSFGMACSRSPRTLLRTPFSECTRSSFSLTLGAVWLGSPNPAPHLLAFPTQG